MNATTRQRPVMTADGASIHVEDWGDGLPVVVTHGWSAGHEMWEYQMTALAAQGLYRRAPVAKRELW